MLQSWWRKSAAPALSAKLGRMGLGLAGCWERGGVACLQGHGLLSQLLLLKPLLELLLGVGCRGGHQPPAPVCVVPLRWQTFPCWLPPTSAVAGLRPGFSARAAHWITWRASPQFWGDWCGAAPAPCPLLRSGGAGPRRPTTAFSPSCGLTGEEDSLLSRHSGFLWPWVEAVVMGSPSLKGTCHAALGRQFL